MIVKCVVWSIWLQPNMQKSNRNYKMGMIFYIAIYGAKKNSSTMVSIEKSFYSIAKCLSSRRASIEREIKRRMDMPVSVRNIVA